MKSFFLVLAVLLIAGLEGCQATPMTYDQWKKEQDDKAAYKRAGLPYKSPEQLKAEAADMKKANDDAFKKDAK